MKKFISLVLALVMALSLTTIAWGAPTTVDVTSNAQLATVLKDTTAQEVVINLSETPSDGTHYIIDLYSNPTVNASIKSLTINGTGTTKVSFDKQQVNAALFNKLTINKCEVLRMNTKSWGHIVFGGSAAGGVYTISNCLFNGVGTQGIYFNPVSDAEWNVVGCTFTGDFGTEGAVVLQNNSKPTDLTVTDNDFTVTNGEELAIMYHKENLNLTADADVDDVVLITNTNGKTTAENFATAVANADAGDTFKLMKPLDLTTLSNPVEITDPINIDDNSQAMTGLVAGSNITTDANGKITGGAFETLPDESLLADGVIFVGNTVAEPSKKTNTYEGLYAKNTNAPLAAADVVEIVVTPAKAPKYDKTTGALDTLGEVEHVNITGDPVDYVFVKTLADADVVLYKDAACKQVMFYLAAINTPEYAEGVLFTNFGEDCGEVEYDDYDKTETYFTAKGDFFGEIVVADKDGSFNVMYGGKLVAVEFIGYSTAYDAVDHKSVYTTKNGVVESIECGVCGLKAVKVANVMSLPKGADVVTGETVWYWPAAVADTTTDTKVESAETFDAGIAMYVGMSVMAAAGSAVVLKKKD